ncbi:hypothetical protein, partial [Kocuria sediminis]|uniref:hypothetical protein n=1 Tax=Kocuria sediminis TaxID=1038857 RepID=UPI0019802A62
RGRSNILPGRPAGRPDRMSPIDAAVPAMAVLSSGTTSKATVLRHYSGLNSLPSPPTAIYLYI